MTEIVRVVILSSVVGGLFFVMAGAGALLHEVQQQRSIPRYIACFANDPEVMNALAAVLTDTNLEVRCRALEALLHLGPDAIRPVRGQLAALVAGEAPLTPTAMQQLWQNPRLNSYHLAAAALGMLGDPQVLDILLQFARHDDYYSQVALLNYTDPRALQVFREACSVDYQAVNLTQMPVQQFDPRVVEVMIGNLRDERESIRMCAATLLGRTKAKEAVPALIALLDDPAVSINDYPSPCEAAAMALGEIGDRAAVEPLIARLQTGDVRTRLAVASALGQLGDPQAVAPLIILMEQIAGNLPYDVSFTRLPGDGPNRKPIAEALKALTGQEFGEDPVRWRAWWQAQGHLLGDTINSIY